MLAITQIDVRVTLRIFKNHFQKLHMHFFFPMASVQKMIG